MGWKYWWCTRILLAGKLTLAHNLTADEDGFRGAATNAGGSTGCTGSSSYRLATNVNHADKGEGIYKRTNATYAAGRAKILNGGGGGNSHNAGGGGGGNYTAGGEGGPGWNNCSPSARGIGGISLSSEITVGRIFMGGAGEGNNGFSTQGKNGGGIILVKAEEIETVSCAGITISANVGSVPGTGGNDGGGGAGGTIVFEVDTWTIAGACPLTISANGGNGGNVNTAATHGGGGGGGQGALFFSTTAPTVHVTLETNSGDGGCNKYSDPCNSQASSGAGVDGSGVLDILTGPLPIELVDFYATKIDELVHLTWITKSEQNNSHFVIEKSLNGNDWYPISILSGAGNSSELLNYQTWDFNPSIGLNYYRLKQIDFDGSFSNSDVRSVDFRTKGSFIFPNPTTGTVIISGIPNQLETIFIYDALGRTVFQKDMVEEQHSLELDLSYLPNGSYSILFKSKTGIETEHLIISH